MNDTDVLQHPVLAGHQCKAEYIEQQIFDYKGNPLIEALPELYEPEQVSMLLTDLPDHDDSQRSWGKQIRLHCVQQIKRFMQPLPYHIKLESCFSRIIRDGYVVRNPLSPLFTRQFSIGFRKIIEAGLNGEGRNITGNRPSASGFAIIGLSGVGKSTAVERTLLLYPQVIKHTDYNGRNLILKQLVWLKLECPANGSLKVLCQNFFRQVDLILGTNYYKQHVKPKSNKESLLIPMAQIAALHGLGVLVIDEIQRLKTVKNSGEKEMLNYFTELINTIGVPVVLVGTYKSAFLFESTFAEARRASDQGDHILSNMKDGPEWNLFLESLWDLQWTKKICPLSDDLRAVMYEESQGIPDIAIKLYMNAQWEAIFNNSEEITPALIRSVAKRCLKLLHPMLHALKNGDMASLKKYEDLKPDWLNLNDYIRMSEETILMQGKLTVEHKRALRQRDKSDRLVELVSIATSLGLSSEDAEKISLQVIETSNGMEDPMAMRQEVAALSLSWSKSGTPVDDRLLISEVGIAKGKRSRMTKPFIQKDDPWIIVFKAVDNKTSIREALEATKFLKPPLKEFLL